MELNAADNFKYKKVDGPSLEQKELTKLIWTHKHRAETAIGKIEFPDALGLITNVIWTHWKTNTEPMTKKGIMHAIGIDKLPKTDQIALDVLCNELAFIPAKDSDFDMLMDKVREQLNRKQIAETLRKMKDADPRDKHLANVSCKQYQNSEVTSTEALDRIKRISTGGLGQFYDPKDLKNVEWFWKGRIPLGKLTLISGEQGQGKSTMMADIIARASTGATMPDGEKVEKCQILILSCEDDVEDTAGPKLAAMGADPAMIKKWEGEFTIDQLDALETALLKNPAIKMVMIEPIYEIIKGDTNKINDVTTPLGRLQKMAGRCEVAIVGIHHFGKGKSDNANQKTMGSVGFTSKARATWGVLPKKDTPDVKVFAPGKRNLKLSHALQFVIVDATIAVNGQVIETCKVKWFDEQINTDIDTMLREANSSVKTSQQVEEWLREYLSNGEAVKSKQVIADGRDAGYTFDQLTHARTKLDVKCIKHGVGAGGYWSWQLVKPSNPAEYEKEDTFTFD